MGYTTTRTVTSVENRVVNKRDILNGREYSYNKSFSVRSNFGVVPLNRGTLRTIMKDFKPDDKFNLIVESGDLVYSRWPNQKYSFSDVLLVGPVTAEEQKEEVNASLDDLIRMWDEGLKKQVVLLLNRMPTVTAIKLYQKTKDPELIKLLEGDK